MSTRKFLWRAIVPALLMGATSVHAAGTETETCVFEKYAPSVVKPYSQDESLAYGTYSFLRGAQLFIPAREGLTREWLAASAQQALAAGQSPDKTAARSSGPACSPNVKNVSVTVTSAGNGFWVQLIGRDERTATVLLKWAQGLVDQQKQKQKQLQQRVVALE